jgi:pimeloyl-ACP methyl ester carboxylesterase
VETKLGRLHVYDAPGSGSLPAVVLLHGLSSSATPFGPLLQRLRRHARRVVAPDYPGHGFSEHAGAVTPSALFESVEVVLDALKIEPSIFVGNSLGGAVALHCAIERPERVRALVLVSPAGAHASDEEWRELRSTFTLRSRAEGAAFAKRLYYRVPRILPLFAHELPAIVGRPAVGEILAAASNDELPSPEFLAKLRMPILLIWGEAERLLPASHFEYFVRHLPPQTVVLRPETYAHCPHLDDPADLAARIVEFAEKRVPLDASSSGVA